MPEELGHDAPVLNPPRGMYPARVDERGRLKLPAQFQNFLAGLTDKTLFVTSLDRRIARIYPMSLWHQNEKFFQNYSDNPRLAKAIWFNANDLGSEAEMDNQGRVLLSPELRRALGVENSPVRVQGSPKGHIEVLSEAEYQRQLEVAMAESVNVDELERAGLA